MLLCLKAMNYKQNHRTSRNPIGPFLIKKVFRVINFCTHLSSWDNRQCHGSVSWSLNLGVKGGVPYKQIGCTHTVTKAQFSCTFVQAQVEHTTSTDTIIRDSCVHNDTCIQVLRFISKQDLGGNWTHNLHNSGHTCIIHIPSSPPPCSQGFGSSTGRASHWSYEGCGFDSHLRFEIQDKSQDL